MEVALTRFLEQAARARRQRILGRLETRLTKKLAGALATQKRVLLGHLAAIQPREAWRLREAFSSDDIQRAWDQTSAETTPAISDTFDQYIPSAVTAGGQAAVEQLGAADIGVTFDLENPRAVEYLRARAAERVTGIDDTTRQQLRDLAAQAAEEGWSYDELAQAITDLDGFSRNRAETIAVTELADGYTAGQLAVGQDIAAAGIDMEKQWLAEGDACDDCADNESADWIPIDDTFPTDDDSPPAHPNCRCDLLLQAVGAGD